MSAVARALLLGAALVACAGEPEVRGTNVFLISLDSAAARYTEPYGADPGSTPHLARLAAESVVFETAYSQTATTVSSVASLLSGQRATTHRVEPRRMNPLQARTLVEELRDHGYHAYGFIANPMAGLKRLGFHRGFHVYLQIYTHVSGAARGNPLLHEGADYRVVYPEDVQRVVESLIDRLRPTRTFAYLHYLQPHLPYDPPAVHRGLFPPDGPADRGPDWPELQQAFVRGNETGEAEEETIRLLEARYRANLHYADAGVGALLEALRARGLYDGSLIVLTADHGEAFFEHGRFGHNYTLYEEMTRVPLLMKFPAREGIAPRRLVAPTATVDLLPTLLDYLGIPVPPHAEGESLWPLISGARAERARPAVILSTAERDRHAIRRGRHKLILAEGGEVELYDLEADPGERTDLAARQPETAARLRGELMRHLAGDPAETGGAADWSLDPELRELLETLGYAELLPPAEPGS